MTAVPRAEPQRRVSVAHVTTISDSLEYLLLDQLRAIHAAGFDVAGISAPGAVAPKLAAFGARHIEAPFVRSTSLTPGSDVRLFAELVRIFRRERFTIVHTHTAKADLYAAAAARAAGVPIVITTLHGFYFHELMSRRRRFFYSQLAKLGMRFADRVLSQNPEDVETARRDRLCDPAKLEVLGNGIDVERFDRARDDRLAIQCVRDELGIAPGQLVVGFVGRLVAEKGVLELFEAARSVRSRVPNVKFLFIGPFDRAKQDAISEETAQKFGLADACVFTGHRDDLPPLYALMDVFALPSHREGFPRTPMEAASMGVPVVATDIRGCRQAVADKRSGLLVPRQDPAALATALLALLEDEPLRRRMGEQGRLLARESFDQRNVFARVLEAYEAELRSRGMA